MAFLSQRGDVIVDSLMVSSGANLKCWYDDTFTDACLLLGNALHLNYDP